MFTGRSWLPSWRGSFPPLVKWTGSKRSVAALLGLLLPWQTSGRFFDPFLGGGALLPYRPALQAVAGDVVAPLVNLWRLVRADPALVGAEYTRRWHAFQQRGTEAYYEIRTTFNDTGNPHDLLFLSRTAINGLVRFNRQGQFNSPVHHKRPGIHPAALQAIIRRWSAVVQEVEFRAGDFRQTLASAQEGDIVFLDPPYGQAQGMYQPGTFVLAALWTEMARLTARGGRWILTYDERPGTGPVIPPDLGAVHLATGAGISTFRRLLGRDLRRIPERVYLNFAPPAWLQAFMEPAAATTLVTPTPPGPAGQQPRLL